MAAEAAPAVNWRQTITAALVIAVCAAAIVWWLEGFNRQRLIDEFRRELAKLPTFTEKGVADGG